MHDNSCNFEKGIIINFDHTIIILKILRLNIFLAPTK